MVVRVVVHSLFLGLAAIVSVVSGFVVYAALRPADQVAVQAPVALLLIVTLYCLFDALLPRVRMASLQLRTLLEAVAALAGSLLVVLLVFYPLHYQTQGYVSAFSNITAAWMLQLPAGALALALVGRRHRLRERAVV